MASTLFLNRQSTIAAAEQNAVETEAHCGWSTGWVAKIGSDGQYRFLRADESSLSRAGNGSKTYLLAEGVYAANSVVKSYVSADYFFAVDSDGIRLLDNRDEAVAMARGVTVETLAAERQKAAQDKAARLAEQSRAAAERNAAECLPALTGSPKQIAWAESLRSKALSEAQTTVEEIVEDGDDATLELEAFAELKATADSRFWIDNRCQHGHSLLKRVVREKQETAAR